MLRVKRRYDDMLSTNQEPVVGCTSYSPLPAKKTRFNTQIDFSQRTIPSLNFEKRDQELLSSGEQLDEYVRQKATNNQNAKKTGNKNDFIFTTEDILDIVSKAVSERENELREEYDNILSNRLYQQQVAFSSFNNEFISQKLKKSVHDYTS